MVTIQNSNTKYLRDYPHNSIMELEIKNKKCQPNLAKNKKMDDNNNNKDADRIQALRDMISNAEITLQGARAMLLQLEGKKKTGRRRKPTDEDEEDGRVIEGTFDGQIMIGTDGRQYPVPANYASKSKLVKGDMMKLTISSNGSFVYKQIGPIARKMSIGTINQDADGNYFVASEGRAYRVLLASITYFKVEPGDEVTLITPVDIESEWGAIENVIQRTRDAKPLSGAIGIKKIDDIFNDKEAPLSLTKKLKRAPEVKSQDSFSSEDDLSVIDEWAPDLDKLRKELEDQSIE
jgi:hypothetical protein